MNKKLASVKNFVENNKNVIIAMSIVTPIVIVVAQHAAIVSHNEFLKENDLYDTYYADTEE